MVVVVGGGVSCLGVLFYCLFFRLISVTPDSYPPLPPPPLTQHGFIGPVALHALDTFQRKEPPHHSTPTPPPMQPPPFPRHPLPHPCPRTPPQGLLLSLVGSGLRLAKLPWDRLGQALLELCGFISKETRTVVETRWGGWGWGLGGGGGTGGLNGFLCFPPYVRVRMSLCRFHAHMHLSLRPSPSPSPSPFLSLFLHFTYIIIL